MEKLKSVVDTEMDDMVCREASDDQPDLDEDEFDTQLSLRDNNDLKDVTLAYSLDTCTHGGNTTMGASGGMD